MSAHYGKAGVFEESEIFGGGLPPHSATVSAVAGSYERGQVLGVVTANGHFALSDASSSNGSETPAAICAEDLDVTTEGGGLVVYVAGQFRAQRLKFGPGHTAQSVTDPLWLRGIHLTPYSGAA